MRKVIMDWPRTMENSLTNMAINQRAFVGHCACCYDFNCPEYITRMAWKHLTERQRIEADAIAQKHINNWRRTYENKNRKIRERVAIQVLF